MVDAVKVLTSKKETVYGTDAAPTLAANAILTRNFSATPVEVDALQRNLDSGSFGATPQASTNERQSIRFETEMAGSGAAGTAPPWMELLEGCGMAAPVLVATTSATQQFAAASAAQSSLTHYHWMGNQRRKALGSRGTFGINWTAGAYPFLNFAYVGMLPAATPFDVNAPGAATLTRWKDPVECNLENTLIELDGYACITRSLELNANLDAKVRALIGARYVNRGDHGITGRLSIEAPSVATKNFLQTLRSSAIVDLSGTHGLVAGNIIEIGCAHTQVTAITEREEDKKLMWDLDLLLTVGPGQEDLIIVAK
jgi:hypothetical protein